jgi:hypothetical protein
MGWFLRKSFRLLPGIKINLSKSGPRVSVGVPGARASIDVAGKTRIYGSMGPVRYQKSVDSGLNFKERHRKGILAALLKGVFGR